MTSIVACGMTSKGDGNKYEWMLSVDCDLQGAVQSDWTIFSRKEGLTPETVQAINAIIDGIAGLRTTNIKKPKLEECA